MAVAHSAENRLQEGGSRPKPRCGWARLRRRHYTLAVCDPVQSVINIVTTLTIRQLGVARLNSLDRTVDERHLLAPLAQGIQLVRAEQASGNHVPAFKKSAVNTIKSIQVGTAREQRQTGAAGPVGYALRPTISRIQGAQQRRSTDHHIALLAGRRKRREIAYCLRTASVISSGPTANAISRACRIELLGQ